MSGLSDWIADVFPEGELPHVLRCLQRSLGTLRKESPHELENSLSMRLLKFLRCDSNLRDRAIQADPEVYADGGETGIEGRQDIRFTYVSAQRAPAPYLVVEAKRLHVTYPGGKWASLVSEYTTGHQGMMCFITGRYAGDQECGIMVGYVFDGDTDSARASVHRSLKSNAQILQLIGRAGLKCEKDFAGVFSSSHSRRKRPAIKLYHLFQAV